jgi:hypothetical protein
MVGEVLRKWCSKLEVVIVIEEGVQHGGRSVGGGLRLRKVEEKKVFNNPDEYERRGVAAMGQAHSEVVTY